MFLRRLVPGLLAAGLLSTPVLADDPSGHRAVLQVGPFMGGKDVVVDLRSNYPGELAGLFVGIDPTPFAGNGPLDPVFGLNPAAAHLFIRVLDADGRDRIVVPSAPGAFGPAGLGVPAFVQYLVAPPFSPWVTSNVVAVELQPLPPPPGFFVDQASSRLPAGWDSLNAGRVHVADIDRDGYSDLVVDVGDDVRLWINDGTGEFVDETAQRLDYPSGVAVGGISVVDVDGDNRVDLVIGGGFDDTISETLPDQYYRNNGNGTFALVVDGFPDGAGLALDFELADLDGDGDLDAVVANGDEQHVGAPTGKDRIYFSSGGPTPTWTEDPAFAAASWNNPLIRTTAYSAGDIDNDGDLDLIGARIDTAAVDGTAGQDNLVLVNDGFGVLANSAVALSPLWSDNTQDVALSDLDLDGDLDIAFANSHGTIAATASGDLYLNQGGLQGGSTGAFVEDTTSDLEISTPADWVRLNVEAGDLDADGDPDLFVSIHDLFLGADQLLFLNLGGAQGGTLGDLARQFWFDPGDFISYGVALLDIEKDGDLDVLQTAQGVVVGDPLLGDDVRLYVNTNL